jgi:hypothetical protein
MAREAAATFGPRDIYRSFRAERNVALHRVLRRLPDPFIVALIEGLEQADVITPGRLFSGERGGCAVGVTLRVLYPHYRGRRRLWGRCLRKSVMRLRRGLAFEVSHLFALEQVFDRSVLLLQERFGEVPPADVAKATALWIAGEARTELVLRELDSDWLAETVSEPVPAPSSAWVVDQELDISIVAPAFAACAAPAGAPA